MMPGTIDEPAERPRRETEPSVACVMLVDGRPEMVRRAIASYHAQTYERKRLLVLNSGPVKEWRSAGGGLYSTTGDVNHVWTSRDSIGNLRNQANGYAREDCIAHFDSDDWSHPARLAEQVAALLVSGAEVVGYRDALFYDSTKCMIRVDPLKPLPGGGVQGTVESVGEAWRYCGEHPNTVFGASLLYLREVWEKRRFPSRNTGEDTVWLMRRNVYALSGFGYTDGSSNDPRMICEVHGGNTSTKIEVGHKVWQRARSWDDYCRERMAL